MSEYVDDPRLSDAANAKWREITESDRALTFSDLRGILEPNPNLPDCPSRIVPVLPDTFMRATAMHVRGRVWMADRKVRFGRTYTTWEFEVTSETGGGHVRVAGDDGYRSQSEAFAACEFTVAAAREAWMRGFGRRARGLR